MRYLRERYVQDGGHARHPTARDKGKEPIVPDNVPGNNELSSCNSPNLSPVKSSKAGSRQRHSHRLAFSNADNGTFHRARRETGRGRNQPNEVLGNASTLPTGVMLPMPPIYPAFGTRPMLYIPLIATIRSPNNMLSSPLG